MKNSGLFLNMAKWCFLGLFFWGFSVIVVCFWCVWHSSRSVKNACSFSQFFGLFWGGFFLFIFGVGRFRCFCVFCVFLCLLLVVCVGFVSVLFFWFVLCFVVGLFLVLVLGFCFCFFFFLRVSCFVFLEGLSCFGFFGGPKGHLTWP